MSVTQLPGPVDALTSGLLAGSKLARLKKENELLDIQARVMEAEARHVDEKFALEQALGQSLMEYRGALTDDIEQRISLAEKLAPIEKRLKEFDLEKAKSDAASREVDKGIARRGAVASLNKVELENELSLRKFLEEGSASTATWDMTRGEAREEATRLVEQLHKEGLLKANFDTTVDYYTNKLMAISEQLSTERDYRRSMIEMNHILKTTQAALNDARRGGIESDESQALERALMDSATQASKRLGEANARLARVQALETPSPELTRSAEEAQKLAEEEMNKYMSQLAELIKARKSGTVDTYLDKIMGEAETLKEYHDNKVQDVKVPLKTGDLFQTKEGLVRYIGPGAASFAEADEDDFERVE